MLTSNSKLCTHLRRQSVQFDTVVSTRNCSNLPLLSPFLHSLLSRPPLATSSLPLSSMQIKTFQISTEGSLPICAMINIEMESRERREGEEGGGGKNVGSE